MQVPDMDPEVLLAQFNRLLTELLRGNMNRNTFQPWEIEILLDIEACDLKEANKREILRRYQKAVHREMEKGLPMPFRLSQYLENLKARKAVQSEKREARERGTGTLN